MPTYEVKDNKTGKVITFDWHDKEPPTEADIEEIFQSTLQSRSSIKKDEHPLNVPPSLVEGREPALQAPWFNPIDVAVGGGVSGFLRGGLPTAVKWGLSAAVADLPAGIGAELVSGKEGERTLLPLIVNVIGGVLFEKSGSKIYKGLTELAKRRGQKAGKILEEIAEGVEKSGLKKGTEEFGKEVENAVMKDLKEEFKQMEFFDSSQMTKRIGEEPLPLGRSGEFIGEVGEELPLFEAGKGLSREKYIQKLEKEARKFIEARTSLITKEMIPSTGDVQRVYKEKPGMEQWLSREMTMNKTPWTRRIYTYARAKSSSLMYDTIHWRDSIHKMLKESNLPKLSSDEAKKVLYAIEGQVDMAELSPAERIVFDKLNGPLREKLDSILYRYAIGVLNRKGIDTSKISNLDQALEGLDKIGLPIKYIENYFPHIFQGDYWLNIDGKKVQSFKTALEALNVGRKTLKADPNKIVSITVGTELALDDILYLNRRGYEKFVDRLRKSMGKEEIIYSREDIQEMLSGIVKARPSHKFVGNFLERITDSPHYEKDMEKALDFYGSAVYRKLHLDDYIDFQEKVLNSAGDGLSSSMRAYVRERFEPAMMGRPTYVDKVLRNVAERGGLPLNTFEKFGSGIQRIQFVADMGYSALTAIAQVSQQINTLSIVGPRHFKSYHTFLKKGMTEAGRRDLKEAFDLVIHDANLIGRPVEHISQAFSPSGMFRATELGNRVGAYLSGKSWGGELFDILTTGTEKQKSKALSKLELIVPRTDKLYEDAIGLSAGLKTRSKGTFAIETAFETVQWTQGQYGKIASSSIFDPSFMKALIPYKQFLINQMRFSLSTAGPQAIIKHPKEALMFLGAYSALGGVYSNPLIYGYAHTVDLIQRFLWPENETVLEWVDRNGYNGGLIGKLGADISGAVAVNIPWKKEEIAGRAVKVGIDMTKYITDRMKGIPGYQDWDNLIFDVTPSQLRRTWEGVTTMQTGEVRSYRTDQLIDYTDDPFMRGTLSLIGIKSPTQLDMQRAGRELTQEEMVYSQIKKDYRGEMGKALARGDMDRFLSITDELIDKLERASDLAVGAKTDRRTFEAIREIQEIELIFKEIELTDPTLKYILPERYRRLKQLPKTSLPLGVERLERPLVGR